MNIERNQTPLLWLILLLSLLLHLALLRLIPKPDYAVPEKPVETRIEVVPRFIDQQRDLDIPVRPELVKPREEPARRLGPADQVVKKEMAPRGDSLEDMRPDSSAPEMPQPEQKMAAPQEAPEITKQAPPEKVDVESIRKSILASNKETASQDKSDVSVPVPPVTSSESLLQLPQPTIARLDREWRQKYRPDVEEGDAVWLDSEQDLLYSFFQRLRTNIYNVWNYPARAAEQGRSGACLLQIVVNKDGTLERVEIKESSGFPDLDRAATAAVRKGAPYGTLPQAFDKERLKILAFFHYELSRNPFKRPGRIY
ncbi:MAG: hypothetical protein C0616_11025 [Desulfuromonas sp.]|nr:MAG: hypothetical protein C0616_11025 [Desulfuromonas sp.]